MINVGVITGTRADYGLLYWLLMGLKEDPEINLEIIVTGAHLSESHGNTYKIIEGDGFEIKESIPILQKTDQSIDVAYSTSEAIKGFSSYFEKNELDVVIILGDRYEALAAAISSLFARIPVMHIHGGEITSGAYDDMIRHSITKMSTYHATSNEEHSKRVIQLGEDPKNIRNYGAPGLELLKKSKLLTKDKLSELLNFNLEKFFLFTYHPETLSDMAPESQIYNILEALNEFQDYNIIFTYPNADDGGLRIINAISNYSDSNNNRCFAVPSLGQENYFSALSSCDLVVGNSSSGIIEAPSAGTPSINIGERQLNRVCAKSVIHSKNNTRDIVKSIKLGLSDKFRNNTNLYENPYSGGNTSTKIINWLKSIDFKDKKIFNDLEVFENPKKY